MKISYLVDTDWVIHFFAGVKPIVGKLQELRREGLAISIISLAELYEGVFSSRNIEASRKAVDDFQKGIMVMGIDEEICRIFGRERGKLRREGKIIGDFDLLIAATCLHHDLTLLTNNRKHFERVEELRFISL